MNLNINDSRLVDNPSRQDVLSVIEALEEEQFVILTREENFYIQTYFNENGTYDLEYRDGSNDRHFRVDPQTVTLDDICIVFGIFVDQSELFSLLKWEKVNVEPDQPDEGEVEYNGVIMVAGWPEKLEAAQNIISLNLSGALYPRIQFGTETHMPTSTLDTCVDCGVLPGQLHGPDCGIEQCPCCRGILMECECVHSE